VCDQCSRRRRRQSDILPKRPSGRDRSGREAARYSRLIEDRQDNGYRKLHLRPPEKPVLSKVSVWTRTSGVGLAMWAAIVFGISFFALSWDIGRDGIAATYSDPVANIRAQDEAIYVNSAIRMTQDADWLTPKVMGRLFFQKPPLLMWFSALLIKVFGLSLFAVRGPALLMGAAGATAVFIWSANARSILAGIISASVLVLSPFWQTFSRLMYTDILASAFSTLALAGIALDPKIERRMTRILFGVCAAAAILAKSVAGLIPFVVLLVYYVDIGSERRPQFLALVESSGVALAVAAPWHVYQAVVHRSWFLADYLQQLGVGANA